MTVVLSYSVFVSELTDVPYRNRASRGAYGVVGTREKVAFRVAPETPIPVAACVVTVGSSPPAPPPDVSQSQVISTESRYAAPSLERMPTY